MASHVTKKTLVERGAVELEKAKEVMNQMPGRAGVHIEIAVAYARLADALGDSTYYGN